MKLTNLKGRRIVGIAALSSALVLALAPRFAAQVATQKTDAATLTVRVTGARNSKGVIRAALFQDGSGFPNDASKAIRTQPAEIDQQSLSAQIVFADLPEGNYAVSVFHDENMNQKLDKNLVGKPKEGYGASNNPKKKMGPPSFEEAKLHLSAVGQDIEIKLIY